MRQAIEVKFIHPTNKRPARLKAIAAAGSVTVGYHSLPCANLDERYFAAACELCRKFDWQGSLIAGGLQNGSVVFVFADQDDVREIPAD